MSTVTQILSQIEAGDPQAAEQLLPLVYDELRKLAAARLAQEKPGQTLQATALVHEAYLRLVGPAGPAELDPPIDSTPQSRRAGGTYDSRGHFFASAAEAMRRILVESARRKQRLKRGGDGQRVELDEIDLPCDQPDDELLAVHELLDKLAGEDPQAAELVKLRYFAGFSLTDAAQALGISRTKAYEQWAYARAWLRCALADDSDSVGERGASAP
jgi:RNA polymerase sigma factor (sigma-70 family)